MCKVHVCVCVCIVLFGFGFGKYGALRQMLFVNR